MSTLTIRLSADPELRQKDALRLRMKASRAPAAARLNGVLAEGKPEFNVDAWLTGKEAMAFFREGGEYEVTFKKVG